MGSNPYHAADVEKIGIFRVFPSSPKAPLNAVARANSSSRCNRLAGNNRVRKRRNLPSLTSRNVEIGKSLRAILASSSWSRSTQPETHSTMVSTGTSYARSLPISVIQAVIGTVFSSCNADQIPEQKIPGNFFPKQPDSSPYDLPNPLAAKMESGPSKTLLARDTTVGKARERLLAPKNTSRSRGETVSW